MTQVKPAPRERPVPPQKQTAPVPAPETGAALPAPELPADTTVEQVAPGQVKRPG